MKTTITLAIAAALVGGAFSDYAHAQRGMGDPSGIARQAVKPDLVTLSGKLLEIKTGPCEKTTGRSPIGTHLVLETAKGEKLNVHLGPQAAVAETVAKLKLGEPVTVQVFRTEKLPENQYIAQSLQSGDIKAVLRDAGLRPTWAGQGGGGRGAVAQPTSAKDLPTGGSIRPAGGRGRGGPPWATGAGWRGGRAADAIFAADREVFHGLLEDHQLIHRQVTNRPDGVETVTQSDDPDVALAIQGHVAAMHRRLEKGQPIHMRDPLFAAIFSNATKVHMQITNTEKGVRVVVTSDDPYVVRLIQAHAQVVGQFVANGFPEARQDHSVPAKP